MQQNGPFIHVLIAAGLACGLAACGGGGDDSATATNQQQLSVAKAECGAGDVPETGLQGQVPMADRANGFKGYKCNLDQLGSTGSTTTGGGFWRQFIVGRDKAGHVCGYAGGANWTGGQDGTAVVDLTDPSKPTVTQILTTPGFFRPGEGIRTHDGRGLLMSGYYANTQSEIAQTGDKIHGFDVYDIGTDCRHPQVLSSTTSMVFNTAGLTQPPQMRGKTPAWTAQEKVVGHEGAVSPDGLTYYLSDTPNYAIHAVDINDPTNPRVLASYQPPGFDQSAEWGPHGLSVSNDGSRVYLQEMGYSPGSLTTAATGKYQGGLLVMDTTAIQARLLSPTIKHISASYTRDGSFHQMTIPIKIKGKPYLITTDEGGTGQDSEAGNMAACAAGRTPVGMAKIWDITNDAAPVEVKKLLLETMEVKNCDAIKPEMSVTKTGYTYDVHMCSVDNRDDATTLACSYFNSGIRVYDIRDPLNVKEIAYFNPPTTSYPVGSPEISWCGAIPILDASKGMIYSHCADSGVLALKFRTGVWPFPGVSTPSMKQL